MKIINVPKSKFKPRTFEYLRRVEKEFVEIRITDHGREVVRMVPFSKEADQLLSELRGLVIKYEDPFEPVGEEDWEAMK